MDRILAAAEQVFAERGFDGARTREIAARAGVNVSTLHYHYTSKVDLYAAVLRAVLGEVRERVLAEATLEVDSPRAHLERIVGAHFKAIAARPHFPRLLVDALVHAPESVRAIAQETVRPTLEALFPSLVEAHREGVLRPEVDARHAILSAIGMNMIYFLATPLVEQLFGPLAYEPRGIEERKGAVIDLLLHGIIRERNGS